MVESNLHINSQTKQKKGLANHRLSFKNHKRIASMGRNSLSLLNEVYSPLDAINRFINLALQSLDENAQSRQFLIESKKGIRKTSVLLKRLNYYLIRIEEEINKTPIGR